MTISRAFALVATLIAPGTYAQTTQYPELVREWRSFPVPPRAARADYAVWSYAAGYSQTEWEVLSTPRGVAARVRGRGSPTTRMPFVPKADKFQGAQAAARVSDGWLVGFNLGEFGAGLYWFSETGKEHYAISGHQVVDFLQVGERLLAIEGLAHLSRSDGSVISVEKTKERWQASTVVSLPFAPYAAAVEPDKSLLVVLSGALVRLAPAGSLKTLVSPVPWEMLYPTSAVLAADNQTLYVGMRQYVAAITLASGDVRLLAPNETFLNRLPADQEKRIRAQMGG